MRRQQGWGKAVNNLARVGRAVSMELTPLPLSTGGLEWRDRNAALIDVLVTGFPQIRSPRNSLANPEDASSNGSRLTVSVRIQLLLLD